jgi:hypothetical protein
MGRLAISQRTGSRTTQQHTHLTHPDKSAVALHSISLAIKTNTSTISTQSRYPDQMIREATTIKLHTNMNRKDDLWLSQS